MTEAVYAHVVIECIALSSGDLRTDVSKSRDEIAAVADHKTLENPVIHPRKTKRIGVRECFGESDVVERRIKADTM